MKPIVLITCFVGVCCCPAIAQPSADEKPVPVSEKHNPPEELKSFWDGIQSDWVPRSEDDFWTEAQRTNVQRYCRQYARNNNPDETLPKLIKDLKVRNSEVRTFIYTWIVVNWKPAKVKALLKPYYSGKDPVEKQIAGDFLAEVEQLQKGEL